jgi:hypothetical protein
MKDTMAGHEALILSENVVQSLCHQNEENITLVN